MREERIYIDKIIIVRDGTYSETVDVNRRLTIRSEDRTDDYYINRKAMAQTVIKILQGYRD
ncbi:MAG: hypothetical protein OCU22_07525 [Canidatus Methanoxibalbensis ujae]|nr:hypothetical protein [Candidatus Methanoxibalbensis ujae]